jgi:hypothetical protein
VRSASYLGEFSRHRISHVSFWFSESMSSECVRTSPLVRLLVLLNILPDMPSSITLPNDHRGIVGTQAGKKISVGIKVPRLATVSVSNGVSTPTKRS